MVALLVRLKLALLRQTYARSTGALIGSIAAGGLAAVMTLMALIGLVGLRQADASIAGAVTVAGFAVASLAWLLSPLLFFGVDQTLDTRQFALLPVPARRLAPGLLASAFVSVPSIAFSLCAIGLVLTWSVRPIAAVSVLVAAPVGVTTGVLLARLAGTAFGAMLAARRTRELMAILLAVVGSTLGIGANLISRLAGEHPEQSRALAERVAAIAELTPFGWAWAVPADLARGRTILGVVHLVLAVVFLAALYAVWVRLLARSLCAPYTRTDGGSVAAHGVLDRTFGAGRVAAVAARSLRYWRRDPRLFSQLSTLMVVPVVVVVTPMIANGSDDRSSALIAPVLVAFLGSNLMLNALSFDGPALWLHIASGLPGRVDRLGRLLAYAVVAGPIVLLFLVGAIVFTGRDDLLVPTAAATVTAFAVAAGVALAAGAVVQQPVPPPGSNPFQQRQGGGAQTILGLVATQGVTVVLCLPVILLVLLGHRSGALMALAWVLTVVLGGAVLAFGVVWGGRRIDSAGPEILQRLRRDA